MMSEGDRLPLQGAYDFLEVLREVAPKYEWCVYGQRIPGAYHHLLARGSDFRLDPIAAVLRHLGKAPRDWTDFYGMCEDLGMGLRDFCALSTSISEPTGPFRKEIEDILKPGGKWYDGPTRMATDPVNVDELLGGIE